MAVGARANRYNFVIALFVTLGSFTYGFNSAAMAGVLGLPSFYVYFAIDTTTSYGNSILGAVNGVFLAGGAIGCWSLAWLADAFGRRVCIQVVCVICILSAALQCGSVHVAMLLVGRLLNGVGIGMVNCIVPTYQSEIAPARQRGRLVGLHATMGCVGYVSYTDSHFSYTVLTSSLRALLLGPLSATTSRRILQFNGVCLWAYKLLLLSSS